MLEKIQFYINKMKKLIDQFGVEYPIREDKKELFIGKDSSCDIVVIPPKNSQDEDSLAYSTISGTHAFLFPKENILKDNNSKYGTYINDKIVNEKVFKIKPGNKIRLGALELEFVEEN